MRCSVMDRNDFNDVIHTTSTWTSIKQQKFCYFYWRQICFSSIYNLLKTRNSNIDSFDVREANQDVIEWVEVYGKAFWCHSRDTKMSESENWLRNNLWIIIILVRFNTFQLKSSRDRMLMAIMLIMNS